MVYDKETLDGFYEKSDMDYVRPMNEDGYYLVNNWSDEIVENERHENERQEQTEKKTERVNYAQMKIDEKNQRYFDMLDENRKLDQQRLKIVKKVLDKRRA